MERILLASDSARRRELLGEAGIPFDAVSPDVDESLRDDLEPADRVLALAEDKARAARRASGPAPASPPRLILAADTLVCLPHARGTAAETAMGKPEDAEDARRMLRLLAGRTHFVRTGLALLDRETGIVRTARSDSAVGFAPMSEAEIQGYIQTGEWSGVAGAYRIQGLAAFFIDSLEGSWTGVVGLPMRELYVILSAAGYRVPFDGNQGIRRP
jgi:septum formation protein